MCLLNAFWKVISPVPVTLKRFLALELVLTFGININNQLRLHPAGGIAQAIHLLSRTGNWAAKVRNWMDFPSIFPQKKRHIRNMPLIIN